MEINKKVNIQYRYDQENKLHAFAMQELNTYLRQIVGEEIISEDAPILTICVREDQTIQADGFKVEITAHEIILKSKESRGILYAVYSLLERIGCDFTLPLKKEQYIPQKEYIRLEIQNWQEEPSMPHRGICFYGVHKDSVALTKEMIDWMAKNRFNLIMMAVDRPDDAVRQYHTIHWEGVKQELLKEITDRGILLEMSEHSTDYFFPRAELFEKHPEWFALKDGKRVPIQICYANEEAIAYYTQQYIHYISHNKEVDRLGIWPLDGEGYCECEKCQGGTTILRAIDQMAKAIQAIRPDLPIEHLAYTPQSYSPPDWEINDNLSVLYCDKTDECAKHWAEITSNRQGAYYFEYQTGDHYRYRGNVWLKPNYCEEIVRLFTDYNYKGIISLYLPIQSFWAPSINYYYLRKAYWEKEIVRENATEELVKKLYGDAFVKEFLYIHEAIYNKLLDNKIWSRYPFKKDSKVDRAPERNKEQDRLNEELFNQRYQAVMDQLEQIDLEKLGRLQKLNYKRLKAYCELQNSYYHAIDLYDYRHPEKYNIAELYKKVKRLNKEIPLTFVPEEYLKWRVAGRDSVLIP